MSNYSESRHLAEMAMKSLQAASEATRDKAEYEQRYHLAERKRGYRRRDRVERAEKARPCQMCGGPLWPVGHTPARVRSDRKTCSDRCRQALRRKEAAA